MSAGSSASQPAVAADREVVVVAAAAGSRNGVVESERTRGWGSLWVLCCGHKGDPCMRTSLNQRERKWVICRILVARLFRSVVLFGSIQHPCPSKGHNLRSSNIPSLGNFQIQEDHWKLNATLAGVHQSLYM